MNGLNVLTSNTANEGYFFTPQNIQSEADLVHYLRVTFPLFSNNDIAKVLYYYQSTNASVNPNDTMYATSGDGGATAVNQSSAGTGQQQRADDIYGESTFVCPSYWIAEAYSSSRSGGKGYKFQLSIPPSFHEADLPAYFDYPGHFYSADFNIAVQRIWGNFITTSNPSISSAIADGLSTGNVSLNDASAWPPYEIYAPYQLNLNTTCPSPKSIDGIVYCQDPMAVNEIGLVNAYTWEGGRGTR